MPISRGLYPRGRGAVTAVSILGGVPFALRQVQCKKWARGASLVAQWLGVCLPVQGTRVRALVWEDPTCRGAARPVSHNC